MIFVANQFINSELTLCGQIIITNEDHDYMIDKEQLYMKDSIQSHQILYKTHNLIYVENDILNTKDVYSKNAYLCCWLCKNCAEDETVQKDIKIFNNNVKIKCFSEFNLLKYMNKKEA